MPGAGHGGQPGPECISHGRQRAVWGGIKEQVGAGVAREVILVTHARGKNEARRFNASGSGGFAQACGGFFAVLQQPEHAAFKLREQAKKLVGIK